MKPDKFSVTGRLQSFTYAFNGIRLLFRSEHNSRIQLAVAVVAIIAAVAFHVDKTEWIVILFAIGFVLAAELINTSVEKLADFVSPGKDDLIKKVKDLSAAAVLIASLTSAAAGLIVFLPRIFILLNP
jgi:diacylglycerol kinase